MSIVAVSIAFAGCSGGGTSVPMQAGSYPAGSPSLAAPADSRRLAAQSTVAGASDYVTVVKGDVPLAYYRLNETAGTVAADSSGNQHNGKYVGTVALGQSSLLTGDTTAKSASFASGYVTEQAVWTNPAVTAECWIKPTAADVSGSAAPRILGNAWANQTSKGFMLYINQGKPGFWAGWKSATGTQSLTAGTIYYLVATYDGTTGTTLYVNGAQVASAAGSGPNPANGDSSTTYLGVLDAVGQSGLTEYFRGDVSDCAVYNHVLTAQQVSNHYAAGLHVPAPTQTPTSSVPGAITYSATSACIKGVAYANNGIAGNNGEFDTLGFNRTFWQSSQTRTLSPQASWPGLQTSWGRFQYDTYFGDQSDGSGHDPFNVAVDPVSGVQALSILAEPMPANMANNPTYGDGWTASSVSRSIVSPAAGGSITIPVSTTNVTHQGWLSGIGRPAKTAGSGRDDPQGVVFLGTVTAGGCTVQGNGSCTGGSTSITLSNVKYYEGGPGVTIPSGADFQDWGFTNYYSGTLDLNLNIEYGFFVARIRTPKYLPAVSPAFWTLQTGGEPSSSTGIERNEDDVMEMFGNRSGNALNAGQIRWNSGNQFWPSPTGVYNWPYSSGDPSTAYHDYGVLFSGSGTTFYLDGKPIISSESHLSGPDWTNGVADKEIMDMFQVSGPGDWLDASGKGAGNPWPLYLWTQWMRVYQPASASC